MVQNPQIDISVVTVTYRSGDCIAECVDSVRRQERVRCEMIAVDNASPDETAKVVGSLGRQVRLIQNRENVGFGRACNQGFKASQGKYVYFLNPDSQLVGDAALKTLCQAMEAKPRWGLAGTCLVRPDGDRKRPQSTYPGQLETRNDFDKLPGQNAWVGGASMIVRREAFTAVGGFDEDFFLYSEETDLCLRLRKAGWEIGMVSEVEVRHIGGASESNADPYDLWRRKCDGLHLFWRKHYEREDVVRLLRRECLRARYRTIVNGVLAAFLPRNSKAWQKQRRYRATWRSAQDALKKL